MARRNAPGTGFRGRAVRPCILVVAALLLAGTVRAQRTPGSVTVGVEVGHLGGATAKLYRPDAVAYSTLLTTDGDDFFVLYLHRLRERPLPDSPVHLYYGPGLAAGGEGMEEAPTLHAGVTGQVGLNFYSGQFEVFLHATPIVRLHPSRGVRLAGSVGLRYSLGPSP